MKCFTILTLSLILILFSSCSQKKQPNELQLWYNAPAAIWDDALPVGNGRLGAMDYGTVYNQHIQFNEESLWAGKKFNSNNPDALKDLAKVRELIFDGKIKQAAKLGNKSLLGTPPRFRSYQTFGDLFLSFEKKGEYSDYRRELSLNSGISKTTFTIDGVKFTREVFASAPDNIIVVHISADKPGKITTQISLKREKDAKVIAKDNYLLMEGQIIDKTTREEGEGGANMKFAAKLVVLNNGGEVTPKQGTLSVKDADELTLLLTAATDYNLDNLNFDRSINPVKICNDIIAKTKGKAYSKIKSSHIKDHSEIFNRVKFDLGGSELDSIPTDERLLAMKKGSEDPGLITLYYQYGRYLLMGSSRSPGKLPANLQGVWNNHIKAPWNSDYHTNINLQ
ncbi:MAG: glycoside hydrolase family 95 protein, partial [Thermoplasmata archaeon]